jgi:hypothetical protein
VIAEADEGPAIVVESKRGDEARLSARDVYVLGRRGAGSFEPTLWSTLAMTRRMPDIGG